MPPSITDSSPDSPADGERQSKPLAHDQERRCDPDIRYRPTEVALETGSFQNLDPTEIELIPWVRFHKTFTAHPGSVARTVFVVNSAALPAFLDMISRFQGFGTA